VLSLSYPLHQSLGHARSSQSSLMVSWQRICNSLTVATAHIKSSFCRQTRLFSVVLPCTPSILILILPQLPALEFDSLISTWNGPHRKHSLYCWQSLFTTPLPSNRSPIVPHVCLCGIVLSDLLPSNRHGGTHRKQFLQYILYCSVRAFQALPRNGSTCHIMNTTT
jgi:hypothetical protein